MPINYTTQKGDTPSSIAVRFYGDGSKGALIISVNPGLRFIEKPESTQQKLIIGQSLNVPDQVDPIPGSTPDQNKKISLFDTTPLTIAADDQDEITLTINGKAFRIFNNYRIRFAYDKIGHEFSFDAPFDPTLESHRDAFKPIFQPTALYIGGKLVISGQSWATPELSSNKNSVNIRGYSITNNINKTSILAPFEFVEGTKFSAIISDIASRFGLSVVIDNEAQELAAKPFEKRIEFSPSENAGTKITELARQLGLILGTTFNSQILVTKPLLDGVTVQAFVSGQQPTFNFKPTFNADALHTDLIGYPPEDPYAGSEPQNINIKGYPQPGIMPRIKGVTPSDIDNQNIEDAIRAERGREFANWFSATLSATGWRDRNSDLYQPNKLVSVKAPGAMIYEDTLFFVRSVTLNKSDNRKSATLGIILPEALSGKDLTIKV